MEDYASRLQFRVRLEEAKQRDSGLAYYEDDHIRQSIVHTREDLVLLVCYARSAKRTLKLIACLLVALILECGYALWKH
jgi:hypothetical protein